jgi:signal transduction histidine kinase
MTAFNDLPHRRVFLLTASFLFAATVLRSVLTFPGRPYFAEAVLLLVAWLALFAAELSVTPRWRPFFSLYLVAQCAITVLLLGLGDSTDFFAILFGILSMQAMQRLGWRAAAAWILAFTPLTAVPLAFTYNIPQAVAFALMYAVVDAVLGFFTITSRRIVRARERNATLANGLRATNREIEAYSRRIERSAAAQERHRLARELHVSVTQTVFSMNLTAQSAALLVPRGRAAADDQLQRLEELARGALAEIRSLGSELAPATLTEQGLAQALRRHAEERRQLDGLSVDLIVEGDGQGAGAGADVGVGIGVDAGAGVGIGTGAGAGLGAEPSASSGLSAPEELCLFRIAQEALNNVVKHSGASRAAVRLWLAPPCRLEIEDRGCGFDPPEAATAGGMGLAGMRERAAGIGWSLDIISSPGAGTLVLVEQAEMGESGAAGDAAGERGLIGADGGQA